MVRPRHIGQTRLDAQESRQRPGSQRNIHTITHRAPVDAVAWKSIAYNPSHQHQAIHRSVVGPCGSHFCCARAVFVGGRWWLTSAPPLPDCGYAAPVCRLRVRRPERASTPVSTAPNAARSRRCASRVHGRAKHGEGPSLRVGAGPAHSA